MSGNRKRILLTMDPGTDDIFALLVFLYGEKHGQAKIEAIVCCNGNSSLDHTSKNLIRALEILHRTDIPVYAGVTSSILPPEEPMDSFFGEDGFGDLEHEKEPDLSVIKKELASTAMRKLVVENPGEISLVCLGPLTDAALTTKLYDDFAPNLKEIVIMGGSATALGNMTRTTEFNFYGDPEAVFIVLDNAKCPVTLLPWDTCINVNISLDWRFNVLGAIKNPIVDLLNRAEKKIYSGKPKAKLWDSCDTFTAVAMLYPEKAVLKKKKYNTTVELHGRLTRGQTVLDHLNKLTPNVDILQDIDDNVIKSTMLKVAGSF